MVELYVVKRIGEDFCQPYQPGLHVFQKEQMHGAEQQAADTDYQPQLGGFIDEAAAVIGGEEAEQGGVDIQCDRRQRPDREQHDFSFQVVADLDRLFIFVRRLVDFIVALRFEEDVAELAGPAGDLLRRAFQAGDQALAGDVFKAALTIAPKAVSNFAKGVDMAHSGMYKDAKGYKVLDATGTEAAMKMIGFQPATVKNIQESNYLQQRTKDFYNQNLQDLRARMANAIFTKDADERQAVLQTMATWNQQNPDQRITLDMPSVLRRVKEMSKSKDQRIADTAPKGLRAAMRAESAKVRESMD